MRNRGAGMLRAVPLLLLLFGLSTSVAAAADPVWTSPPADISSPSPSNSSPELAVAPDGTVVAIWSFFNGTDSVALVATRPPGGSFGAPVQIPAGCESAADPQVAVAPDGTVVAVWTCWNGLGTTIQLSTRPPGGSFSAPVELSASGDDVSTPQLVISADGTVTVIWRHDSGGNYTVRSATRPPGGSFGAPVNLSGPGTNADGIQLVAAPDGTVTVAWIANNVGSSTIQTATRPPGGSFGAPVDVSAPTGFADRPQLAVSPDGTVTVVWTRSSGGLQPAVEAATRSPGGSFGAPVQLSEPGAGTTGPQLAVSPDGTVTVVWDRDLGGGVRAIESATRVAGGSFGAVVTVAPAGTYLAEPQLAVSPDGTVTVVWATQDGPARTMQVSTRAPGGAFGPAVSISTPGSQAHTPHIVASPDGSFTIAWVLFDGPDQILQAVWSQPVPVDLSVIRTGSGSGTVSSSPAGINCGSDCSAGFGFGTAVTLTAAAASGSTFTGWSGDCSGKARTCSVTMDRAREVTASFTRITVPVNPPNDNVAIYDPATGKLKIRLKCGRQYKPKCLAMVARAVVGKAKRAKVMSSQVKVKNRKAGKWGFATLKVRPRFRQKVKNMGSRKAKTLWVRIKVTWKKNGRKRSKTVHHRYRVMVR